MPPGLRDACIDGITRGHDIYGPMHIDSDQRDFVAEAREEIRDACVYLAAAAVRQDGTNVRQALDHLIKAWQVL
jgi:hypothetical protein